MIYFTTFIFTLLLAHIARAMPQAACGYASPQEQYNLNTTNDDGEQLARLGLITQNARFDVGPTKTSSAISCKNGPYGPLRISYDQFNDFPSFPYIGSGPGTCGQCWKFTTVGGGRSIYVLVVDIILTGSSFIIGSSAFADLSGAPPPNPPAPSMTAEVVQVPYYLCGLPSPTK